MHTCKSCPDPLQVQIFANIENILKNILSCIAFFYLKKDEEKEIL